MRKNKGGGLWLAMTPLGIYTKLFRGYKRILIEQGQSEDTANRIANIGAVKNTPKEWRAQHEH